MGQEQRARGLRWHSRAESSLPCSGDLTLPRALGCGGWGWCRWEGGGPEPAGEEHRSQWEWGALEPSEWGVLEPIGVGSTRAGGRGEHRSWPEGRALEHLGGGSSGAGRSGKHRASRKGEHRSQLVWGALEHVGVGSIWAGRDYGAGRTRPLQQKLPRQAVCPWAPAPVMLTSQVPPGHGQGSPLYLSGPELNTPEEERAEPWPRVRCRGYPHIAEGERPERWAGCGVRSEPGLPAPRATFPFGRGGLPPGRGGDLVFSPTCPRVPPHTSLWSTSRAT